MDRNHPTLKLILQNSTVFGIMYLGVVFCCLKISTIGVLGYNGGMDNNILPTDEYVTFEDRAYLNPNLAVTETNQFIDNLRNTQQANNAQINQQTQRLGTDVPSDMGGLTGAQSYWTSRYQTPQTNSVVNDLRASAQASALNRLLSNQEAMWKKRYQEAYNSYQKRAWDKNNVTGTTKGDIEYEDTDEITGLTAEQDINQYDKTATVYDSTEVAKDSRSTERNKNIEVSKDANGNVTSVIINGVPHYGRDAKARYRYLKNAGLVR